MISTTRSHLDTHEVAIQRIGAGLLRRTCLECRHVGVGDDAGRSTVSGTVPEWMQAAAERFATPDRVA